MATQHNILEINLNHDLSLSQSQKYVWPTLASISERCIWWNESFDSASAKAWSCLNKSPPPLEKVISAYIMSHVIMKSVALQPSKH